jgi:hypothetical protein
MLSCLEGACASPKLHTYINCSMCRLCECEGWLATLPALLQNNNPYVRSATVLMLGAVVRSKYPHSRILYFFAYTNLTDMLLHGNGHNQQPTRLLHVTVYCTRLQRQRTRNRSKSSGTIRKPANKSTLTGGVCWELRAAPREIEHTNPGARTC